ncbi:hypothetical protein [Stutzerimonas azotifigens]|uniref:hypothetical protein n=1 Tax=Stutzerimonas azotifigens TaxID=291995 RepID=UPI00047FE460|nr:hypothetical protein [Stutzerimonas azotifigens]
MSRYEIAFSGQLVPGAEADQVKANLARLFQADAQRIDQLFSGRRIVLKQNLDAAAVEKYRSTLERAGARAEVSPMDPPAPLAAAAPAAAPAPTSPAAGRLQVAPRDEYMAAFADIQAPDFGIAPVGADLQDRRPDTPAPALDLGHLSLAPVGSDMGETPRPTGGPVPNVAHLTLKD